MDYSYIQSKTNLHHFWDGENIYYFIIILTYIGPEAELLVINSGYLSAHLSALQKVSVDTERPRTSVYYFNTYDKSVH